MTDGIYDSQTFPTARSSLRQALAAMWQMPIIFLVVLVATFVFYLMSVANLPDNIQDWDWGINQYAQTVLESAFSAFILTPMIIAVHRFVLLGEVTRFYVPNIFSRRFLYFLFLSLVYQAMFLTVAFPAALFGLSAISIVSAVALCCCAIWLGIRIILVFPAAAVDAPGASFRNAFADSHGSAWEIFVTMFLIGLLVAVVQIAAGFLISMLFKDPFTARFLGILNQVLGQVVSIAAFAVAASHIFRGLATRLKASVS